MRYYEIVTRKIIRVLRYRDIIDLNTFDIKVQYWIDVYCVPTITLKRQVYYDCIKQTFPNTPNQVIDGMLNHAYPKTKQEKEYEKTKEEIQTQYPIT